MAQDHTPPQSASDLSESDDDRAELFVRLLAENERRLTAYVMALLPHAADADDVLQETKLAIWRSFDQFEEGTSFGAWARAIAFHRVLDSTFSVYGLIDESLDAWTAIDLRWESAPGNMDAGAALDDRVVRKLGEFRVPRGRQTGQVSIGGSDLCEFLNTDTNGMVTLIVVRDTPDTRSPGLVHGFANRRHPTAAPPTLELLMSAF